MMSTSLTLKAPKIFSETVKPSRYKVLYGGRGSGKSWWAADYLLLKSIEKKIRVLCTREFQTSIKDSVHKLLSDRINDHGLTEFFEITKDAIRSVTGSEFIFKGLRRNINEIKSTEGIDYCWVEEAEAVSEHSWEILTPTIRKPGSEIWIVFNPDSPDDATYRRFVKQPPTNAIVIHANWSDNPYFPEVLDDERKYDKQHNEDIYDWKWGGVPRIMTDAQVFHKKFIVDEFETPKNVDRFFIGIDYGFAADPTAMTRSFVVMRTLYIDYEAYGHHIETDNLPDLFERVPEWYKWPIKADSARPETTSYLRRHTGADIRSAKKWSGSVQDGVEYLRGFEKIVIHPRCKNLIQEFKLYSYKIDRNTGDILPVIVDAHNHGIDSLRYGHDGYIGGGSGWNWSVG